MISLDKMYLQEVNKLIALEVMGYTCIHEKEIIPVEVLADRIQEDWKKAYGEPCPRKYAMEQAQWDQEVSDYPDYWCKHCHYERVHGSVDTGIWKVPDYWTDIMDAWQVVIKVSAGVVMENLFELRLDEQGTWFATFGMDGEGQADTPSKAICKAALQAKGVDFE